MFGCLLFPINIKSVQFNSNENYLNTEKYTLRFQMVHIQSRRILDEQLTRMFVNCKQIQYTVVGKDPKFNIFAIVICDKYSLLVNE